MRIESLRPRRSGFTLIELLVVIAIIAILLALTAGAVFRVSASQAIKRSETTVKKIQVGLEGQWKATIDNAKDELRSPPIDPNDYRYGVYGYAKGLAGGDPARLRAIYIKLRLIQEFPTSFAEAVAPAGGTLGAKPTYVTALSGATAPGAPYESAICLYLAINQGRRGQTFNNEDLGAGSVKSMQCGSASLNYFVDAWGGPITFDRWIANDADPLVADLSQSPYVPTNVNSYTGSPNFDKEDPESALYIAKSNWSQNNMNNVAAVVGHPITQNAPRNRGFVIRSPGPNKNYFDGDDILGYRLMKEGQRGAN
jgi:prepilin-type N-terminal cleavage/methylation domain-containing protein